ncbi:SRPBCC family protein [Geofilum sp. OHC36d9]|uniref:SRPBCC family protein n=1 Tax=Geofilum sp. OHC36d9 TaxID=3458413 RepID=UPI004034D081
MKEIRTEIEIHANVSTVWNVLMNFENYPNWNPFIKNISGEKASGKRLTVSIKPPDANGMTFKPVILKLEPNNEFRWRGKLGIKGIFDGEHFFILERVTDDKTKFIHGERFSGLLVSLMGQTLNKTKAGFEFMNEAIKRECESK